MSGIADLALGAAPIAGGALLGTMMGAIKGPDLRTALKSDIELLKSLPEDNIELRAELKRTIDMRVYELVALLDRNRELRMAAGSYKGDWRDIFVFLTAVLFTLVWWNVPHSRSNWTLTFVVLLIASTVIGFYAARGFIHLVRRLWRRVNQQG